MLQRMPPRFQENCWQVEFDLTMTTEYTMFEALKHIGMPYDLVERGIEIKEVDTNRACLAFNLDSDPALINIVLKALEEDNKDLSVVQP